MMSKASGSFMSTLKVNPALLFDSPFYVSRDLSLLEFQRRVLELAKDETIPLLERVKFLAIFGSNMDEFFMLRISGIHRRILPRDIDAPPLELNQSQELAAVRKQARELYTDALQCLHKEMLPELDQAGIHFLNYAKL